MNHSPQTDLNHSGKAGRLVWLAFVVTAFPFFGAKAETPPARLPAFIDSVYATDKPTIQKGQQLFQQNCSACHNFKQKGIGPNLVNVTTKVSADWLRRFVRNAPEMIEKKDSRSVRLFEEYNQVMPAFTSLSDGDLKALLAYLHQNRRIAPKTDPLLGNAVENPVPTKIAKSDLRLGLEEVTVAPASSEQIPLARINKMGTLTGKQNRQFIVDLRGTLYEMTGKTLRPYMDMAKLRPAFIHKPGLATGFGSFAFHPDFDRNGLLYTTHTEKAGSAPADFAYADSIRVTLQWVLTEWKTGQPGAETFSGTGRELLRVNMVSPIHGVQEITFNPLAGPGSSDYGLLYVGVGDGGASENGYPAICRDSTRVWGKVLRIDPAGRNSKNGRYGLPKGAVNEIFCRGFRNPNRIVWTPDGTMLISDIGHANIEEVNIGVAGGNYGWPDREGTFVINPGGAMDRLYARPSGDAALGYRYPVIQYDHDEGNAVSGGVVYEGTAIPSLKGKYLFGDIVNGRVFMAESSELKPGQQAVIQEIIPEIAGKPVTFRQLCGASKTDLRIGVGLNQELYLFTKTDGKIYRVVSCSSGD